MVDKHKTQNTNVCVSGEHVHMGIQSLKHRLQHPSSVDTADVWTTNYGIIDATDKRVQQKNILSTILRQKVLQRNICIDGIY